MSSATGERPTTSGSGPMTVADAIRELTRTAEYGLFFAEPPGEVEEGQRLVRVDAFTEDAVIEEGLTWIATEHPDASRLVRGTYLFRDVVFYPAVLLGHFYHRYRRMPILRDRVVLRFAGWADACYVEPGAVLVLPGDGLVGPDVHTVRDLAELRDRLFDELYATVTPIVDTFRRLRLVGQGNAWGSVLDSVLDGFLFGATTTEERDAAWEDWEALMAGRLYPHQRRPRRFRCSVEDGSEDTPIRAGCCLWYTTSEARNDPDEHYCYTCYLENDDFRAVRFERYLHSEEAAH